MTESEIRAGIGSLRGAIDRCLDLLFDPGPLLDSEGHVVMHQGRVVVDGAAVKSAAKAAVRLVRLVEKAVIVIPPLTPKMLRAYLLANGITPEQIDAARTALADDDPQPGGA